MNKRKTVKIVVDNVAQQNARDFWQQFDNMQEKINNLQSKIDKVKEVLNQYMPNYASCVKALDEIEFILKEDK